MKVEISDISALHRWVQQWVAGLKPAVAVALRGPLGVGKTQFCKALVEALGGSADSVSSPTFAIHQRYDLPGGKFVDHVDLYRLHSDLEIEGTGFWDLFATGEWVLIEWSERIDLADLPSDWQVWVVELQFLDSARRSLEAKLRSD